MPSAEHEAAVGWIRENPLDRSLSWREQRAFYDATVGAAPLPEGIKIESRELGGRPAEILSTAEERDGPLLLHLHGGGYVLGSNAMYREFGSRLTRATELPVVLLEYRLAPEHPFPAALADTLAAYRELLEEGREPQEIAITGDSAGGGLAIALQLELLQQGLPLPGALVCMSPWTDLAMTGDSLIPGAVDDPLMDAGQLRAMARAYAGDALAEPRVSPLYGDLACLPAVLIMVGTRELLVDDARRLRALLEAAGVEVEYYEAEGLIHCWPVMVPNAPESDQALAQIADFLSRRLTL